MLKFNNIEINVGSRRLFRLDSLELERGLIALVGRNGCGKSTFIRSLLKEHGDYKGNITLNGRLLTDFSKSELATQIAVVYTRTELFGNHSVRDVILLGRLPHQGILSRFSKEDLGSVEKVANQLEIGHLLDAAFQRLSDGEKQLVMIARALVQDTPLILMDEPGAYLDLVNRVKLVRLLKDVADDSQKLIIFSTHHIDLLDQNCDGALLITNEQMSFIQADLQTQIKNAFNL
ncbi:MAG: ABC transporter ATP-binding protein [Flavobacteriales bacterium]|nr:ABC transporter ATP-binding protein [Flavobacteriales bacterium]